MRLFKRRKSTEGLMSLDDYAAHRGVSKDTVYRYIRDGKIQSTKIDGAQLIDQVRADFSLDGPAKNRNLHMAVARCKNWCKKRRYQIVTTILLLALIIPAPGILTEYARRGRELKALEAENAGLRETVNDLLGLSEKYTGLMDVSEALGLDYEDAVNALRAENPNVKIPELTIFALLDRSTYFADWIGQEVETDRRKLAGYMQQAERTPNIWPVQGRVTGEFGWQNVSRGSALSRALGLIGNRRHTGIDIGADIGTRVNVTAEGEVTFSGTRESYGNLVIVSHGTYQTYYGHLSRITVQEGDRLNRGDRVGEVGSTGTSTGPHLHYEVRVNGSPVNPRRFLP